MYWASGTFIMGYCATLSGSSLRYVNSYNANKNIGMLGFFLRYILSNREILKREKLTNYGRQGKLYREDSS